MKSSILNRTKIENRKSPVGILDSGVGGLSVLREIRAALPAENLIYVADQARVPYGPRSTTEIRAFSQAITQFLLNQQAKLIVVACNTASAAALSWLRETFPQTLFVGMEPAIKPAAAHTKNGRVGVLATTATIESERYAALRGRFARDVTVYEDPCIGLVDLIESGDLDSPRLETVLRGCLDPMLAADVDTIVLGCTHYPFVLPVIERIAGTAVTVIDPAPAIARQTQRILQNHNLLTSADGDGSLHLLTTAAPAPLTSFAQRTLAFTGMAETVVIGNQ
ncbi:MAG TPA: glutamate racemase [Chloroflexi bacterium]|nr:glutamate racemase [Chloroflexota bacterium]